MITLSFVLGVVIGGALGWLHIDRLARQRDRYRSLFYQATSEIGRVRRQK